jgi:hypothetical protein
MFFAGKHDKWLLENPDPQTQLSFMKSVVAQMFLKGDINSPYLQNCFSYTRTFYDKPYIKAAYQATTKPTIWKKVKDNGDDFDDSYCRDENNLIHIGTEFGD